MPAHNEIGSNTGVSPLQSDGGKTKSNQIEVPAISLLKGGGAIKGIGEKFAANPVTGTGSMTVPIFTSPGRSGFGPQLSLSYDSGAGNGPFGMGWSLAIPSITRKTDKGLPRYQDAGESDIFILSGAEDLVPTPENVPPRRLGTATYRIQRYRPRVEGLFARIERWTNETEATDTFWRSISKDNITTLYGRTAESRIADPTDATHIFSWLICRTYDDKGNLVVYNYKQEDSAGIDSAPAHELNRTDDLHAPNSRSVNQYLKRIRYGNRIPVSPDRNTQLFAQPPDNDWMFEVVFDYGEHNEDLPHPSDDPRRSNSTPWLPRNDPFSSYRSGFEIRTYRLCQRVLMFHHFPGEPGVGTNCLVRSTDFTYSYEENPRNAQNPVFSFLNSVSQVGYKRNSGNSYLKQSLPPLEFTYSEAVIQEDIFEVDAGSLENLPYGLDNAQYQWIDLDGEGLSGILTEQATGWFYKRNFSPVNTIGTNGTEHIEARFESVELIASKPDLSLVSGQQVQFLDLAGDGQLDVVTIQGDVPGYFERTDTAQWEPFIPFRSLPVLDWGDPNLKFIDLTGDGYTDILISENDVFSWYPSLGEAGFNAGERIRKVMDEEKGPRLVFNDGTQSIYLADMSGDGLTDLVRICNGEVSYWPNLGYGRFGAKVTMDNAPHFDSPCRFNHRYIRLADIDGSGVTDIIYLGGATCKIVFQPVGQ